MRHDEAPGTPRVFTALALLVLALVAGPIGTAVFVLGFGHGESPCILCWAQRTGMALIALAALFILRYGPRPRYVGFAMLMSVAGIYMSVRHSALHVARDIGQGFSAEILGAHTNTWSMFIFWTAAATVAVLVMALGDGRATRHLRTPTRFEAAVMWLFLATVAANALQAFASTGPPPYVGQSDPVRFSFDPRQWVWSLEEFAPARVSLRGRWAVPKPGLAGLSPDPQAGPFDHVAALTIVRRAGPVPELDGPATGLAFDAATSRFLVTTGHGVVLVNADLNRGLGRVVLDPAFSVDLARFGDGAFLEPGLLLVLSENKSFVVLRENPAADGAANFRYFLEPGPFDEVARGRFATVRAKMAYVRSAAFDPVGRFIYTIALPNPRSPRLVVSRFDRADMTLTEEFLPSLDPAVTLRPRRSLDELYVTGATLHEGRLYALSAAYSLLVELDVRSRLIIGVHAIPDLRRPAGLAIRDRQIYVLEEDGHVVVAALPPAPSSRP